MHEMYGTRKATKPPATRHTGMIWHSRSMPPFMPEVYDSRFVPELTLEERREIREIAIGRKDNPIHVELPERTR